MDENKRKNRKRLVISAIVLLLIGTIGTIIMFSVLVPVNDYGIMIDAGSSGSRVHIYWWPRRVDRSLPLVEEAGPIGQVWSKHVSPGISASSPTEAAKSLKPLLDYASSKIPAFQHKETPIYVFATAGMRLLPENQQTAILTEIRKYIHTNTNFEFNSTNARVISGVEEGVFGWITVNYLLKNLRKNDSLATVGAMDMGGASTEITFVPNPSLGTSFPDHYPLQLAGHTYDLWVHSYLKYGINEARKLDIDNLPSGTTEDPCLPLGFNTTVGNRQLIGNGDFSKCAGDAEVAMNFTKPCIPAPPAGMRCSFDGVNVPTPRGSYVGFSAFQFAFAVVMPGVTSPTMDQVKQAAQAFCAMTYDELRVKYGSTPTWKYITTYCFEASYMYTLMTKGYGFDVNTKVSFVDTEQGIELGWALGAMILEASLLPIDTFEAPTAVASDAGIVGAAVFLSLLAIGGLLFGGIVVHTWIRKRRLHSAMLKDGYTNIAS